MNIITPPTDSLYKFLCVSGLILIVYSFYEKIRIVNERKLDIIELRTNIYRDSLEFEHSLKFVSSQSSKDSLNTKKEFIKKVNDLNVWSRKIDLLIESDKKVFEIIDIIRWIGSIMTIVGYLSWFFWVQRPQDKILASQAKDAEKNIKTSK